MLALALCEMRAARRRAGTSRRDARYVSLVSAPHSRRGRHVDVEHIGNGSFVLHVSPLSKGVMDEVIVERAHAVVNGSSTEHPKGRQCSNPGMVFVIVKTQEERALPSATSLRHSVNGFLDTAAARTSVGAKRRIPGWRVAVLNLVRLEVAYRDKVPSAHAHACGVGDGCERTKRRRTHGRAECSVVVDAMDLVTAVDAKPGFN
eukprot:2148933-Pleurochrysis_carterae.AAC.4